MRRCSPRRKPSSRNISARWRAWWSGASAKARDEAELYLLLADQIEDKEQKKAFVRKAMSVSGRE